MSKINENLENKNATIETDFNDFKPRKWLLVILIIIALIITAVLATKLVTVIKNNNSEQTQNGLNSDEIMDEAGNIFNKVQINSFNSLFERYQGTEYGSSVSSLLDEIITNNKKNKDRILTVKFIDEESNDPETIKNYKKTIDTWDKYEVSINYDEVGFANEIIIELIEKYKNTASITAFNTSYESYSGTEYGLSVKNLLDNIVTNNKTNQDHILTVIYKNTNTTDVNVISNLKKNFADWTKYEVSLDYNEEGYVYQIKIGN